MQRRLPGRVTFLSSLVGLSTTSACIPEFDEDPSLIEEPRILAVRAEPAEGEEGDAVKLAALVAVPQGDAPFTPRWAFCSAPKPLTELGPIAQPCIEEFGSESPILTALGNGDAVDASVPDDACLRPDPAGLGSGRFFAPRGPRRHRWLLSAGPRRPA